MRSYEGRAGKDGPAAKRIASGKKIVVGKRCAGQLRRLAVNLPNGLDDLIQIAPCAKKRGLREGEGLLA